MFSLCKPTAPIMDICSFMSMDEALPLPSSDSANWAFIGNDSIAILPDLAHGKKQQNKEPYQQKNAIEMTQRFNYALLAYYFSTIHITQIISS